MGLKQYRILKNGQKSVAMLPGEVDCDGIFRVTDDDGRIGKMALIGLETDGYLYLETPKGTRYLFGLNDVGKILASSLVDD